MNRRHFLNQSHYMLLATSIMLRQSADVSYSLPLFPYQIKIITDWESYNTDLHSHLSMSPVHGVNPAFVQDTSSRLLVFMKYHKGEVVSICGFKCISSKGRIDTKIWPIPDLGPLRINYSNSYKSLLQGQQPGTRLIYSGINYTNESNNKFYSFWTLGTEIAKCYFNTSKIITNSPDFSRSLDKNPNWVSLGTMNLEDKIEYPIWVTKELIA